MRGHEFEVGYWLLDAQILDSDRRRCGRVDDVEFEGSAGKPTHLTAILTGPAAYRRRLPRPLRSLAERVLTDREVRVPWRQVKRVKVAHWYQNVMGWSQTIAQLRADPGVQYWAGFLTNS